MDLTAATITMVLTGLILAWCLRAERRAPDIRGDVVVLQYAPGIRWFMRGAGIAFFALMCFAAVHVFAGDATNRGTRLAVLAALLLPLCVGGLCEPRVRLVLDGEGVRGRTAFRGYREVAWGDITSVSYSAGAAAWVLRARGGEKIRVARYLVGSQALLTALEAKVPKRIWKDAVAAWRRHRSD